MRSPFSKDTGIKGLRRIYELLEQTARAEKGGTAVIPSKYVLIPAEDMYNQFLKVTPDAKGLLSSSYGASGMEVSFDFYMDFVNFAIPGIFYVPVGASIAPKYADTTFLIIHRVSPKMLPNPILTQSNPKWSTLNPVCFNAMFGRALGISIKASAQALFAFGPSDVWSGNKEVEEKPVDVKEEDFSAKTLAFLEFPLAVGGSISNEICYKYEAMAVVEKKPGWYPSAKDQGLQADFKKVLGEKSSPRMKLDIERWINKFSAVFYLFVTADIKPDATTLEKLKEDYLKIAQNVITENDQPPAKKTWRDKAQRFTGKAISGFFESFFEHAKYLNELVQRQNISSSELINNLQNLSDLLPNDSDINKFKPSTPPGELSSAELGQIRQKLKDEINELRSQATAYINRLQAYQAKRPAEGSEEKPAKDKIAQKGRSQVLPEKYDYLTFLKIASHEAGSSLNITGVLGPGIAGVSGSGSYKATGFRYQTFCVDDRMNPLVYTQDTYISYRQFEFKAEADIPVVADPTIYEKKPKTLNGMTYTSACNYWLYPKGNEEGIIHPEVGSGISLGLSVFVKEIAACANKIKQNNGANAGSYQNTVNRMASHLHVPRAVMLKFLDNDFFRTLTKEKLEGRNALLIESSLRLPSDFKLTLENRSNKNKKLPKPVLGLKPILGSNDYANFLAKFVSGTQTQKEQACQDYLDGLRVRVRMADSMESNTSFKIGPHAFFGGSGGSPGITLNPIKEAGREGIFDIYTVRFGRGYIENPLTASATDMSDKATGKQPGVVMKGQAPNPTTQPFHYEDAVPPVALLHQ